MMVNKFEVINWDKINDFDKDDQLENLMKNQENLIDTIILLT